MLMTKSQVKTALDAVGNTFFTVVFIANDGQPRTYNGRINVKKGLKNNDRSEIVRKAFMDNGVIPLKIDGDKYKAFKLDRVVGIKGLGLKWGDI
jgi:hypothetical protein